MFLRQGGAASGTFAGHQRVLVGPFVQRADPDTPAGTGLTFTQDNIQLCKGDVGWSYIHDFVTVVEDAALATIQSSINIVENYYRVCLDSTDLNTCGPLTLTVTHADCLPPPPRHFFVLPAALYDWLMGTVGLTLSSDYDAAKTAAAAGAAMTLTAAYDAAKTAAQEGTEVTLTATYDTALATMQGSLDDLAEAVAALGTSTPSGDLCTITVTDGASSEPDAVVTIRNAVRGTVVFGPEDADENGQVVARLVDGNTYYASVSRPGHSDTVDKAFVAAKDVAL